MKIYISGILGTGMGPLALMAKAAGFTVCGSDKNKGAIYDELVKSGIEIEVGEQNGKFLQEKLKDGVDWFCHTSALPADHPELVMARSAGVKVTKRDELTAFLVEKLELKMIAVAGTHGKTTTTAMIIWAALKMSLPVSYIVGTTLGFAPSGAYHVGDKYFVYEADEYDKNFLKYHPWLAVIPAVSYDHPDIYPTVEDYNAAFLQFEGQSQKVLRNTEKGIKLDGDDTEFVPEHFSLAGSARRTDAALAAGALREILVNEGTAYQDSEIIEVLDQFPGVGRRFERIAEGVYTDYAHHPEEIAATIDMALEEAKKLGKKGVVAIYEPHQNARQHEVRSGYKDAFVGAEKIFWLPTYLTRENPDLLVLTPAELAGSLVNKDIVEAATPSLELEARIREYLEQGYLILLMTAGPADAWLREKFSK